MDQEIIFSEKQKPRQWWLWIVMSGINGIFIFGIYQQVYLGKAFGNNPRSNTGLLIMAALIFLLTVLLTNISLETRISSEGIYVRFFPFHLKHKFFGWKQISKAYLRTYAPLKEYGGWGIRKGFGATGSAYNISGNAGLQIEFINGKKLLIGTGKPEELENALKISHPVKNQEPENP